MTVALSAAKVPTTAEQLGNVAGQLGAVLDVEQVAHVNELGRLLAERCGDSRMCVAEVDRADA